jgi:hypothetical protein
MKLIMSVSPDSGDKDSESYVFAFHEEPASRCYGKGQLPDSGMH